MVARSNGHLVNLKVSMTDKKVTKVEFKWSDGETSSQGWDADNTTKYLFDIGNGERPIAIFGSASY